MERKSFTGLHCSVAPATAVTEPPGPAAQQREIVILQGYRAVDVEEVGNATKLFPRLAQQAGRSGLHDSST